MKNGQRHLIDRILFLINTTRSGEAIREARRHCRFYERHRVYLAFSIRKSYTIVFTRIITLSISLTYVEWEVHRFGHVIAERRVKTILISFDETMCGSASRVNGFGMWRMPEQGARVQALNETCYRIYPKNINILSIDWWSRYILSSVLHFLYRHVYTKYVLTYRIFWVCIIYFNN